MNYLEIIELRSSDRDHGMLCEKLTVLIEDLNKGNEDCSVKLYRHNSVDTDWSVHLHYQLKSPSTSPSPLGFRISSALQEFGLVHHGVWSQKKRKK